MVLKLVEPTEFLPFFNWHSLRQRSPNIIILLLHLSKPANMPTDRFSKLGETSTSFGEEKSMPPPLRISDSPLSFDPGNNLVGQGDFTQGSSQGYLPSFHRFEGQGRISSSHIPHRSPSPQTWRNALKGWKVAFLSCRSFMVFFVRK